MRALAGALVASGLVLVATSAPVAAQEDPPERRVDISFDVGDFDPGLGDFPVDAVLVQGDLEAGQEVAIELRGTSGELLWSGSAPFTPPSISIDVDPPVAVGEVASAGVAQPLAPVVAAVQIEPPEVFHSVGGGNAGSGQLALSMVLIVALMAIVFRSPLPSASTQRWTR